MGTSISVMGNKSHNLLGETCFARAISAALRRQFPAHTVKTVAGHLNCSPKTAENILNGHLSGATITKLIAAYGPGWVAERTMEAAGLTLETYIQTQVAEAESAAARARERAQEARRIHEAYQAARRGDPGDHSAAA